MQGGLDRWKSKISIRTLGEGTSTQSEKDQPSNSLAPMLCYSCQGTLISRSSKSVLTESGVIAPLPVWTQTKLVDREKMKGAIQEFLIDNDDDEG